MRKWALDAMSKQQKRSLQNYTPAIQLFTHFLSHTNLDLVFRQSSGSTLQIRIGVLEWVIDFMKQLLVHSMSDAIFNFIIRLLHKIRILWCICASVLCHTVVYWVTGSQKKPIWRQRHSKNPYLYFFNVYRGQDQSLMLVCILPAITRLMT